MEMEMKKCRYPGIIVGWLFLFLLLLNCMKTQAATTDLVYGTNGTITRAEWLHDLVVLFDMSVDDDNLPEDYFRDVTSEHTYYRDILTTVEFGVVDIEAGGNVEPDEPVTRMFAASTLNYCLGIELDEGVTYTFSDTADVENAQDAQIAVDRGWLALIDGAFSPDTKVTEAEVKVMFADVQTILPTTEVKENYDSIYEYEAGVIEIPASTDILLGEDGTVTIYDCPATITAGDIFVVYLNGVPQIYTAQTVTENEGETVITTASADEDAAIKDVDAQGVVDGDLAQAQAAEGATITYIEGGTAEAQFEDGVSYAEPRMAATRNINAINLSKSIDIGKGVKVAVGCKLSDLKVSYKIQSANHEVYVACSGNAILTGTLGVNLNDAMGIPSSHLLGTVPVGGIGSISVYAVVSVDGKITVTYTTDFKVGMQYSDSLGFRVIKNFNKSSFQLVTRVEMCLGMKAEAALSVPFIKGSIYAEAGAKAVYESVTWGDGQAPVQCDTFQGWIYAEAGASLSIDYVIDKKKFSYEMVVYDFNNSPVRLVYHWEDGNRVAACTRDAGDAWYLSGYNSRYGNPGDGYAWDDSGAYVSAFTYTVSEDEYKNEVATITGYNGTVYALTIPEEIDGYQVVAIGNNAFQGRTDISIVSIPKTVKTIGKYAFASCVSLEQAVMEDGITEIGAWAYAKCQSLISVDLSKTVEKIGGGAFAECDSLQNITIPKSLTETTSEYDYTVHYGYAYGVFMESDGLKNVTFEEGITEIPIGLFGYCNGLENIEIPATVKDIEGCAFYNCKNLKTVSIPDGVTTISNNAFESCISLTDIIIPDTVTQIGAWAFGHCTSLKSVKLSRAVTKISGGAFADCDQIDSIEIPKSLTETTSEYNSAYNSNYTYGVFMKCDGLKNVMFEDGIREVTGGLFSYCTGLESITIPNTVVTIEGEAFSHCDNLSELTIADSVTTIGSSAFYGCTLLKTVTIPDSVTTISSWAFANCINLKDLILPQFVTKIGAGAFAKCDSLDTVTIPKSLTETSSEYNPSIHYGYATGIFMEGQGPKKVVFEEGTTQIVGSVLEYSRGVTTVVIPDSVEKINDRAFYACDVLNNVILPDSVTSIGASAFLDCKSLEEITIPTNCTYVGSSAFKGCTNLTQMNLCDNLSTIYQSTFYNCSSLTTIDIPDSVTEIQQSAFENAGLQTLTTGKSVKTIGNYAFKGNTALTDVTITDSVTTLGVEAFRDCAALNKLTLGENINSIGNYGFYNCDALTTVEVPDSVRSLGTYCFAECETLTDIKLGTGITEIPSYAFYKNPALKKIVLPYRTATIKNQAFADCTQFTEITIPRATTAIDASAFSYPTKMTVYGVTGTYAETFAEAQGMTFVPVDVPATEISLNKTELKLNKGASEYLQLQVTPENFTDEVAWKTKNTDIITIEDSGKVTAVKVGTATIDVYVGELSATCKVEVVQPVTSISLNKTTLQLDALATEQLTATVSPNTAENKEVIWSSSDADIASVDENGLVTAHKKGTATIKAEAADGNGASKTCSVTVNNTAIEAATVEELESAHNYANNFSDIWIYHIEGAENMAVTFDEKTNIDSYDALHIWGTDGEIADSPYSGTALAGQTIIIPGDTLKLQLITDSSITRWGFKVTEITANVTIPKQQQVLTGTTAYNVSVGDMPFMLDTLLSVGNGTLSYLSRNSDVVTVSSDGEVTVKGAGQAEILITAQETDEFESATRTVSITVNRAEQPLSVSCSAKTIMIGETAQITAYTAEGTASYESSAPDVAEVDQTGLITAKALGTAVIKITVPETANYKSAETNLQITVTDVQIIKVPLSECTIELSETLYVSDGQEKKPTVSVSYGNVSLEPEKDYTVIYSNNITAGQATVTIVASADGNYEGSVEVHFTIREKETSGQTSVDDYAFYECENLTDIRVQTGISQIGAYAFGNCENLTAIYFMGNSPAIAGTAFANVTAEAYYPADDLTWTQEKLQGYGGTITWIPWNPATETVAKRTLRHCTMTLSAVEFTYDGNAKAPSVTVKDGGKQLTAGADYTVSYANNKNAGTGTVNVNGTGNYSGTISQNFVIRQAAPQLKFSANVNKKIGDNQFACRLSQQITDGTVTYSSSNPAVAVIDRSSGTVSIKGAGTTTITASASAGKNYCSGTASCLVTVSKGENNITSSNVVKTFSKKKQTFTIKTSVLAKTKLSFKSNTKSVKVNSSGRVTVAAKFVGKATITITGAGTADYLSVTKKITITVNPKGTKLSSAVNAKGKKMVVSWQKNADVTGYQVQYSTSKNFKTGVKAVTIKKAGTKKTTVSKLKKGKTYYVRIRTYKKVGKGNYYSSWSGVKKVKIKK